jgi:hypothetical protein
MRLVGRILVVLAAAGGPAVVVLIGCNDNSHLPGLQNEVPNTINTVPVVLPDSGTGTGSSSSGAPAGPAMSLCDCAASITAGATACKSCEQAMCTPQYTACQASTCAQAIQCVFGCNNSGPCIANCIAVNPAYEAFVTCLLQSCASACGWSTPLPCPLPDAGTDAPTNG